MYTRLDNLPVYQFLEAELSANHFNHVQVALLRLNDSIRFPIPKLKHLDLILEKHAWIIVDRVLNDFPIAAWTDFRVKNRATLHEPISCRLRLYHANAELILKRTIDAMELLLGEILTENYIDGSANVIEFSKRKEKKD